MKRVEIGIRDFAVPVPRTGSIELHSGYGRAAATGQEIHQQVQKERASTHPEYRAEVPIAREFERGGYLFRVSGRIDGLFEGKSPRIEEIKAGFQLEELVKRLSEQGDDHPYCLQLKTYGYFHWLEHGVVPELFFHLVSIRSRESATFELPFKIPVFETWVERRLEELVGEAERWERRARRRRKASEALVFPFAAARPGQQELIGSIEEAIASHERLLVQAPTGLGKTTGVLFPILKDALARGQRVVYLTPKNSQHAVAEDAIERFQEAGAKVKSLTITAKSKICFKAEPICNPAYCEYARDYYTKVHEKGLLEVLGKKRKLTSRTFRKLGEEHEVCPFELQLDGAEEADTVICDYNYVFSPRSSFGRLAGGGMDQEGKPNLVIDEAHNLPWRAMDYYSPALSSLTLARMREEIRELPRRFAAEAEELLDEAIAVVRSCRPEERDPDQRASRAGRASFRIEPPVEPFYEQDGKLRAFLSRYLESDVELRPKDVVLRLCFYWSEFTAALVYIEDPSRTQFFTTFQVFPGGEVVKITCCDASEMLSECYDNYEQVVGFSATLKPFEYYAKLSGLAEWPVRFAEFQSPFPAENRKIVIIPQISTKYSERERNYPRVAEAIQRIAELRPGNYFAFFPSFEFLERVLERFEPPAGFTVLRQEREMRAAAIEGVLEQLKAGNDPTLVFAVSGGVFSEGVDYPGDMMIGAFIVGPPLPNFDLEREQIREYYEKHYGAGFDYAYVYPAMSKAVQAAGRVIRSERDRGILIFMDNRFVHPSYAATMPAGWFSEHPSELVSRAILRDVAEFWTDGR